MLYTFAVAHSRLNAEQIAADGGRAWGGWSVGEVLKNPKYAGGYRYGRRHRTLDGRWFNTPADQVVQVENVFEPLVPMTWIKRAAERRLRRLVYLPREEIWRRLADMAAESGELSKTRVAATCELPSTATCSKHFGPWTRLQARLGLYPRLLPGQIDKGRQPGDVPRRTSTQSVTMTANYTAFLGLAQLAAGDLQTVALAAQAAQDRQTEMPIVFNDLTGEVIDLDLRGGPEDLAARLQPTETPAPQDLPRGPGRPKLGVTAREVTLLPRHWAWLQAQPGGASATLRRLIEEAQRESAPADARRAAQTATYRVMQALAGHLRGYEAALRALYANDQSAFEAPVSAWPANVAHYVLRLARPSFG